jgi:hypothetical protein
MSIFFRTLFPFKNRARLALLATSRRLQTRNANVLVIAMKKSQQKQVKTLM